MRTVDLIINKKDRLPHSKEEIDFLVEGFTTGDIPDYQISAWLMAVVLNGMTAEETTNLTLAMAHSGETLDLSSVSDHIVDKHSTGGVGDKTTLSVAPIVAACGLAVGKMSGRGLGFTGGTIDKIESIPGIRTNLSTEEFISELREHGIVLTGQSADLAPADGKLYALRDVSGTVQSTPLIASSVMSKKIASGATDLVLDVKVGKGAFMKTVDEAQELAELMVSIGRLCGRRVIAVLTPMNEPLGEAVGNALELKEAVLLLHGQAPKDYYEHCLRLSAYMLLLGDKASSYEEGLRMAQARIDDGSAMEKLREMVVAQHGDVSYVDDLSKLPQATQQYAICAGQDGWVESVDARVVGEVALALGAGRAKKGDAIDHGCGLMVHAKIGDRVKMGQTLFTVYYNDEEKFDNCRVRFKELLNISGSPVDPPPHSLGVVGLE